MLALLGCSRWETLEAGSNHNKGLHSVKGRAVEQGIILKGLKEPLKYHWGPEGEGRFKENMKVFSTENMELFKGGKKLTGKKVDWERSHSLG